jgi:HAD superfamily hydrolase (TIGR01509 family)
MAISVLIFGGIGTLVETSHLQMRAFNEALSANHIDFQWSEDGYKHSLASSGGILRLSTLRQRNGDMLTEQQCIQVHKEKTRRFGELLQSNTLPLRTGVAGLMKQAEERGIRTAWATTTSRKNIDNVIASTGGALHREMFALISDDEMVSRQKPDPQIYEKMLGYFEIAAMDALVAEDSLTGVEAATAAGMQVVAFPGAFNVDRDFGAHVLVTYDVSNLLQLALSSAFFASSAARA